MFKFFKALVLSLALISAQAHAQSLTLLGVGSAGSLIPNGILFKSNAICTTSGSVCTIAGVDFDAPQSNRYIIVNVHTTSCTSGVTGSAGGVSLSVVKQFSVSWIFIANVPTGNNGTVIVNCADSRLYVSTYTMYATSSTADSTCQLASTGNCALGTTVNNGFAVFMNTNTSSGGSCTLAFSGSTQDYINQLFVTTIASAAASHGPTTGSALNGAASGGCAVTAGAAFH